MSVEQLKGFFAALEADTGLQAKLKAVVEGEIDTADEIAAVLAIAKEAGFAFTAADLLRNEAQNILELSDDVLEKVVGARGGSGALIRGASSPGVAVADMVMKKVGHVVLDFISGRL